MDATVTSDGGKTSRSAPASVLREIPAPRQYRPKPTFQKYTVVFLKYNGEIVRLNLDSDWLWEKLRSVVETRLHMPNGARLAALRAVSPISISLTLKNILTSVFACLILYAQQTDGSLVRAANDVQNGEYLSVEMRYAHNVYAQDDEYAINSEHLPRTTAKAAIAAAALHGSDRKGIQGASAGVVAGRRGGVLATAHGQIGTGRGGQTIGAGRGGDGNRPIQPCPVPVRPEETAEKERLAHALAHAELPESEKEEEDAQKWAAMLLGRAYEHHPGDPEGPAQRGATEGATALLSTPRTAPNGPEMSPRDETECAIFPEVQSTPASHVVFPSKRWYRLDAGNAPPPKEDFTFLEFLYKTQNSIGFNRTLPKRLEKAQPGQQTAPPPWDKSSVSHIKRYDNQVRTWNFIEPHMMPPNEQIQRPKEKRRPFVNSPRLAKTAPKINTTVADKETTMGRNQNQDVNFEVTVAVSKVENAPTKTAPPPALRPSVRTDGGDRSVVSFAEGTFDGEFSKASSGTASRLRKKKKKIVDRKVRRPKEVAVASPRSPRPPPGPWKPGNSICRDFSFHLAATAAATPSRGSVA